MAWASVWQGGRLRGRLQEVRHVSMESTDKKIPPDWQEAFRVEFAYDSMGLEGSPFTLLDVKMILIDGIIPVETKVGDYEALRGHDKAWQRMRDAVAAGIPLTERMIQDTHRLAVPGDRMDGRYREIPVYIRGSQAVPPAAKRVAARMKLLADDIAADFSSPLERAARIHGEFSKIQPFMAGNGLTARLMMNYALLEKGYLPISIKKTQKEAYFQALEAYVCQHEIRPLRHLLTECMERRFDSFFAMYDISG